ncbi:iron-sulfur cluster assembly protein [Methanobrevibacter sp. DSM 116169]|uniref:iron-sulfur cluster assembly protein n=1 Tax=Methanobrevibacter sp. DSM 116169 TaxID=3242727 RepID=UPI0038FC2468
MSDDLVNDVKNAISNVNDPHMGVSIVEMGLVQNIEVNNGIAKITIKPTNPGCMSVTRMANDAKREAESVDGIDKVEITVEGHMMADSINEMINK